MNPKHSQQNNISTNVLTTTLQIPTQTTEPEFNTSFPATLYAPEIQISMGKKSTKKIENMKSDATLL
jgi:hypothetical protein